ncbi:MULTISPECIES: cation-translocating P-type ATPase [unclassified Kaistella]|uniref:cation-translocating P-type ATPase n=1 Tax=unclassified Kaistella TaxID=2762626 RepID=UPI002735A2C0|nr:MULTISPECIES: cation-translocating P-type ATPase [unclassified Kaistella]MDP2454536.1 cation-translocating P-type ATPase [Kaistella sp. SH11-4b]MDP2457274.1 cation-translocating P-type ATPase [Kaistella sp. SH40-3]MDP2460034.1 cation-translocating P-type ATPase [Kaistella sp. SH19-2b]
MNKEIKHWFTKSVHETLMLLSVEADTGLSEDEARKRKEHFGANILVGKKKKSLLKIVFSQLNDWLIYVLFAAVIITAFMGEYIDSVIITLVIFLNAAIGTYQEVKAGKAIDALLKMSSPKAVVKRDGQTKEIDSAELVPGDLVILDAGRIIPADLRLLETVNMQIEESSLTGESLPVHKKAESVFDNIKMPLAEIENMAFMSTIVTAGRGLGIVVDTGMTTEVGKIADLLDTDSNIKTPLEKKLSELGKSLGKIAVGICIFIFGVSWLQGRDLAEMFLISVSLAVASIPEGLAAIVAVVLSIGVTAMSRKNAIIRKLPAVETLGSVNIICSDKTGTLTMNKMTVTQIFTSEGLMVLEETENTTISESAKLLSEGMILCSDATLENEEATGDPTEIALLVLGDQLGLDRKNLGQKYTRIGENPFDSNRKMMSVLVKSESGCSVFTKGALGSLRKVATRIFDKGEIRAITEKDLQNFSEAAIKMSDNALRTLVLAYKPADENLAPEDMEKDLVFAGLVGMIDPAREEVKPSIRLAANAGIKTIIITGDHKNTAFAIAKDLEVAESIDQVLTGPELEEISEDEFIEKVTNYRVFARVSPQHKVQIVQALQANGNIVSMTGDGVNDGPSLHIADIGVAMGITGTDVAKNAADMILTDDNFSTIVVAIEQGRNIFQNIKKSVVFLLTCNLGEVLAMFLPLAFGWPAPLIATQLLWINLLTDSLPAIALGMDGDDPDVMQEKPRDANENFFSHGAGTHVVIGGILIGLITIFAFWYGFYELGYTPFEKNIPEEVVKNARTLAFLVLVCAQLFYSLGLRNSKKPFYQIKIFGNHYLNGAVLLGLFLQLTLLFIPVLRNAFKLHMPDSKGWIMALFLGLVPLVTLEIYKIIFVKKHN